MDQIVFYWYSILVLLFYVLFSKEKQVNKKLNVQEKIKIL